MNPIQNRDREHSQLFLVRLWAEDRKERSAGGGSEGSEGSEGNGNGESIGGQVEWCGKLQHVVSGQAQYFRGWPTLIDLLLEMTGTDTIDTRDTRG